MYEAVDVLLDEVVHTTIRSVTGTDPAEPNAESYPLIVVDITADSHPFWTGTQRVLDSAGQVEKFHRRYGRRSGA